MVYIGIVAVLSAVFLSMISVSGAEFETDWFEGLTAERAPTLPLEDFENKSYYFGIIFKATYFKAEQFCRYHGMELLSITSQEENDFIQGKVVDMGLTSERFYTSGTRLPDGTNWVWMSTGKRIGFTNWFSGEPNDAADYDEKCVEVKMGREELKWNDVNCTRQLRFICEISWPSDCFNLLQKINATQVGNLNVLSSLIDIRMQP